MVEQKQDKLTPPRVAEPTPSRCEHAFVIIFYALTVVVIILGILQSLKVPIVVNEFLKWFYLAQLGLFVGQKESLRWFANIFTDRLGEVFVYFICGLALLAAGLSTVWPQYFAPAPLLEQIAFWVVVAFAGTETSKKIFNKRLEVKKNGNGNSGAAISSEKKGNEEK